MNDSMNEFPWLAFAFGGAIGPLLLLLVIGQLCGFGDVQLPDDSRRAPQGGQES